ncbi:MAG: DUF3391 domain-containing protein, partial [Gammaproteobacteria bacterium]
MIKKMRVADLKVGMYVIIPGTWMNHPFSRSQFQIKSTRQIQEIGRCGFYELEVDLEKSNLPTEPRLNSRPEERLHTSPEEEEPP